MRCDWRPGGQLAAGNRVRLWAVNPGHLVACGRRIVGSPVTGRFRVRDKSARNAGGTPGCGTADGAARRTQGIQPGSPPVPAGPGCRCPACGGWAGSRSGRCSASSDTKRLYQGSHSSHGSLAPGPARCRAAVAPAAGCPVRSCLHGRAAVPRLVLRDDLAGAVSRARPGTCTSTRATRGLPGPAPAGGGPADSGPA
jgi:hypothetical protein